MRRRYSFAAWTENTGERATSKPSKTSRYCVAPQKQLDVGNYAFALLFAVRLVSKSFCAVSYCQTTVFWKRANKAIKIFPIPHCSSKAARRRKLRHRFAFCGAPCLEKFLRGFLLPNYCFWKRANKSIKIFPIPHCSSKAARRRELRHRFAFCGAPCLEKVLRGLLLPFFAFKHSRFPRIGYALSEVL